MAEQATINLNVKTDESQKSLRAMRQELKQLQIAMDQASDPAEFKRLEAEFAILRNDMKDTSQAMKYLDPGELLSGWTKMAQGAIGSFAAVTGAMSLFGDESEEIQEIEKKSMALIQTMMGLEQARQLLIDGGGKAEKKTLLSSTASWIAKTLGIKQNTTATAQNAAAQKANAVATGVQTTATGGATIATKLLGVAMKALPILAIIGAVVGLVAAFKSFTGASKRAEEAQASLKAATDESKKAYDDLRQSTIDATDAADDQALRTKVARGEITQTQADLIESEEKFWEDFNAKTGEGFHNEQVERERFNKEIEAENAISNENLMNARIRYGDNIAALNEAERREEQRHKDAIININKEHSKLILDIQKLTKSAQDATEREWNERDAEIRANENKRKLEEQRRAYEAYLSDLKSWTRKIEDWQVSYTADDLDREELALELKRQRELEDLANSKLLAAEKARFILKINEYYDKELAKIEEKRMQARADAFLAELKAEQAAIDKAEEHRRELEEQAKVVYDLRKSWTDAYNEMMANSLSRALEGVDWTSAKEKLLDYYGRGIIGEEEYNAAVIEYAAENAAANEEAYDQGLITQEEYEKNKTAITKAESEKRLAALEKEFSAWTDFANSAASSMSSVFSNLTEMAQMELDAQDKAWQESHDARTSALDDELEKAEEVWGRESEQYKYLLEQQKKAEDDKAKHDEDIEKKRKAADSKYKKGAIASDMAQTTSEFAKATAGIWFTETGTKGVLGVPFAVAMQAVITGVYASQMALMAKQMGLVGKMRLGGPVFGPSHESGGVDRNLEGGEFVINAQSMKVPGVAQLANSLNRAGSAGSVPSVVDEASVRAIVNETVGAIAAIPVVVSERDITGTQRKVRVIESKTNF